MVVVVGMSDRGGRGSAAHHGGFIHSFTHTRSLLHARNAAGGTHLGGGCTCGAQQADEAPEQGVLCGRHGYASASLGRSVGVPVFEQMVRATHGLREEAPAEQEEGSKNTCVVTPPAAGLSVYSIDREGVVCGARGLGGGAGTKMTTLGASHQPDQEREGDAPPPADVSIVCLHSQQQQPGRREEFLPLSEGGFNPNLWGSKRVPVANISGGLNPTWWSSL